MAAENNTPPKILKLRDMMLEGLPRFGPLYGEDEEIFRSMKEDAWNLVKAKEPGPTEEDTEEAYFSAAGRVEEDARNSYVDPCVDLMTGSQFRWMMIKDGIFFLHVALLLLGASEHLGYPVGHGIFGRGRSKADIKHLIKAMLFVGNQIPVSVLRELMKQPYFQQIILIIINQQKREKGIFRLALHDLINYNNSSSNSNSNSSRSNSIVIITDLLHALRCRVLGSGTKPCTDTDLESGGGGLLENEDGGQRFLTATQMERVGIRLKKRSRGGGTKGIKFSTNIFGASLHLPRLFVDDDTEVVFQSLIDYENCHVESHNNNDKLREVSSYLRLMKDMVRSPEDVNLLEKRGVVTSCDLRSKEKLIGVLVRLQGCDNGYITPELDNVGLLTRHYSSPTVWGNLKNILGIFMSFLVSFALIFVLTFLQTYYTVYDHYKQLPDNAAPLVPPPG